MATARNISNAYENLEFLHSPEARPIHGSPFKETLTTV